MTTRTGTRRGLALVLCLALLLFADRSRGQVTTFTYEIDTTIVPVNAAIDPQGIRRVGVVVDPQGGRSEFVVDEVILKPKDPADLAAFLAAYPGTVIDDGALTPPPQVIPAARLRPVAPTGHVLVRLALGSIPFDETKFILAMQQRGFDGHYKFSLPEGAKLSQVLAQAQLSGWNVTQNGVFVPHQSCTNECVPFRAQEHPRFPVTPDPLQPNEGFLDPFLGGHFPWLSDPELDVTGAWQVIDCLGLPLAGAEPYTFRPHVAILDNGFSLDSDYYGWPDYVLQIDRIDGDMDVDGDPNPASPWHGQGALGVAVARVDNRWGGAGTGGTVGTPIAVRAGLSFYDTAHAILDVVGWGADVVNMSFGGECNDWCRAFAAFTGLDAMEEAAVRALDAGVVLVASAGNDARVVGAEGIHDVPCMAPGVICVGALMANGPGTANKVAVMLPGWGSNWGSAVEIWAPGVNVESGTSLQFLGMDADGDGSIDEDLRDGVNLDGDMPIDEDDARFQFSGTSAAAPFVAGVAAMLKAVDPSLDSFDVLAILQATAGTSTDPKVAAGFVNAAAAVRSAAGFAPGTPVFGDGDSDGVADSCDNCPNYRNGPDESLGYGNQTDDDGDGIGNPCDNCPSDPNPGQENGDGDSFGDACDNCPTVSSPFREDSDGDGRGEVCDNCDAIPNPGQENADGDEFGDACDADDDNDGIQDDEDNCRVASNPGQEDADADGPGDACDNCPATPNPEQSDSDDDCPAKLGPGIACGDVCDTCTDTDGDGYGDPGYAARLCPLDGCPNVLDPATEDSDGDGDVDVQDDQPDHDHDGVGNACDVCPLHYLTTQSDGDGDGLGDGCDPFPSCPSDCEIPAAAGGPPAGVCAGCPPGRGGPGTGPRDCSGRTFGAGQLGSIGFCIGGFPRPDGAFGFCPGFLAYVDQCCPDGATCLGSEIRTLTPDGTAALVLPAIGVGVGGTDAFGFDGALIPDLDGDLDSDFAVSAPSADPQGIADAGEVLLVSSAGGQILGRMSGGSMGEMYGYALARHPEGLAIGAPFAVPVSGNGALSAPGDGGPTQPGAVYLMTLGSQTIRRIDGLDPGREFGGAVAIHDDVDADGRPDLLIGAPGGGPDRSKPGTLYLVSCDGSVRLVIDGLATGERFGEHVATVPDLDGDGRSEIAVAAPLAATLAGLEAGRVDLYTRDGALLSRIEGKIAGARLGSALSAGDANGDGVPELLIGAPLADTASGAGAGLALLVSADGTVLSRFSGGPGDHVGRSAVFSPDLNGDGAGDFVIGSAFGGGGAGTARFFFSAMDADSDGAPDAADNCPFAPNPSQLDTDGDLVGDPCDCAPQDPGTHALPGPVTGLLAAPSPNGPDHLVLRWDSLALQAGTGVNYAVVAGDVALLRTPNRFTDARCALVFHEGTTADVYVPAPAAGQAIWYLVRGNGPCGAGTYDEDSPTQVGSRDAAISQSPPHCAP